MSRASPIPPAAPPLAAGMRRPPHWPGPARQASIATARARRAAGGRSSDASTPSSVGWARAATQATSCSTSSPSRTASSLGPTCRVTSHSPTHHGPPPPPGPLPAGPACPPPRAPARAIPTRSPARPPLRATPSESQTTCPLSRSRHFHLPASLRKDYGAPSSDSPLACPKRRGASVICLSQEPQSGVSVSRSLPLSLPKAAKSLARPGSQRAWAPRPVTGTDWRGALRRRYRAGKVRPAGTLRRRYPAGPSRDRLAHTEPAGPGWRTRPAGAH